MSQGRADEAELVVGRLINQAANAPAELERLVHLSRELNLRQEPATVADRLRELGPVRPSSTPGSAGSLSAAGREGDGRGTQARWTSGQRPSAEFLGDQARDAERHGRFDLAQAHWRAALAGAPDLLDAHIGLTRSLRRDGRLAEAEGACMALPLESPGQPRALVELARVADDAQDLLGAEIRWLAAVTAGAPAARLGWSLCLGRQHRFTEARAALEGLIAARPDAIEAPLALGRLALIEGDPDAAQSAFAAVLARWPSSIEARLGLGRVLELHHRFQEALAHYAALAAAFADEPRAVLARGWLLMQQAEPEAACGCFRAARELDPLRLDAWLGLARAQARQGDTAAALALLTEAGRNWPCHPQVGIEHARLLEEAGRAQEARLALLATCSALPHRREPAMELAALARRSGALAEARIGSEAALEAHPRSLDVALLAFDLRLADGALEPARTLVGRLADELPHHRDVEKRLARLEVVDGRFERARWRWKRIARHDIRLRDGDDPLHRCDTWPIPDTVGELRAFIIERNERTRLVWLLDHYRRLGVERFFILDNDSDDGTLDWLRQQPADVHVFHTAASYAAAGYGLRWTHQLLDRFGTGRWCLVVDADEALVYPHVERLSLKTLTRHLDARRAEALFAPMLDMYPDVALDRCSYAAGESLIERFPWFDADVYAEEPALEFPFRRLTGGPRQRCFPTSAQLAAQMEKVPLVRWSPDRRYLSSTHQIFPVPLAVETGLLLHFKYLPGFAHRTREEARRGQHSMGARRYRHYLHHLAREQSLTLHHPGSVRYRDSAQLVALGLMHSSAELDALAGTS